MDTCTYGGGHLDTDHVNVNRNVNMNVYVNRNDPRKWAEWRGGDSRSLGPSVLSPLVTAPGATHTWTSTHHVAQTRVVVLLPCISPVSTRIYETVFLPEKKHVLALKKQLCLRQNVFYGDKTVSQMHRPIVNGYRLHLNVGIRIALGTTHPAW